MLSWKVLPISVGQVIRTKLLLLSMIALLTSTVFLVVLGLLLGQLGTFLLGFLTVAYVTTAYTVTVTAYLTGLRTNSYLFDPKVLAKFSGLSVPPLCALVILSFMYSGHATLAGAFVLVVCTVLVRHVGIIQTDREAVGSSHLCVLTMEIEGDKDVLGHAGDRQGAKALLYPPSRNEDVHHYYQIYGHGPFYDSSS